MTTAWVLMEVADALHMPLNRPLARSITAIGVQLRVVPASEELFEAGFDLFEARPDKERRRPAGCAFVTTTFFKALRRFSMLAPKRARACAIAPLFSIPLARAKGGSKAQARSRAFVGAISTWPVRRLSQRPRQC